MIELGVVTFRAFFFGGEPVLIENDLADFDVGIVRLFVDKSEDETQGDCKAEDDNQDDLFKRGEGGRSFQMGLSE